MRKQYSKPLVEVMNLSVSALLMTSAPILGTTDGGDDFELNVREDPSLNWDE